MWKTVIFRTLTGRFFSNSFKIALFVPGVIREWTFIKFMGLDRWWKLIECLITLSHRMPYHIYHTCKVSLLCVFYLVSVSRWTYYFGTKCIFSDSSYLLACHNIHIPLRVAQSCWVHSVMVSKQLESSWDTDLLSVSSRS